MRQLNYFIYLKITQRIEINGKCNLENKVISLLQ